ncbi:MAG: hypothetical protein ABW106_15550 [Steroidobacteraceae bacterium]
METAIVMSNPIFEIYPAAPAARICPKRRAAECSRTSAHETATSGPRHSSIGAALRCRVATLLFFFEVVEFFLQTTFGKHVLEFAPGGLALFRRVFRAGARTPVIDEPIEILLFIALGDEFIIEIEVIVVSLRHGIS